MGASGDSRGFAFLTSLFVVFFLGTMLFGFMSLSQSDLYLATEGRNGTLALSLAEAGAQEAITRLTAFGAVSGVTAFRNSLAATGAFPGSGGVVAYQAAMQRDPSIFPILSTATYGGAQRSVRILVRTTYRPGWGSIVFGPQVRATGDLSPTVGDLYSQAAISFAGYAQSPVCSPGSTPQNLLFPQVLAGTTISAGGGPDQASPCGGPPNFPGTAASECASTSPYAMTEVAPTSCPGGGRAVVAGRPVPPNWHPMTPIGMPSQDFAAIVNTPALLLQVFGIAVTQATQNGVGVTYQPAGTYTPSYWTSLPSTSGKVLLIIAAQPFCVSAPLLSIALPSPAILGSCLPGFHYYGSQVGGAAYTTRFVDWGLVMDDLTRTPPQTFFQAPPCSTCAGNQNGIRYVPPYPALDVLGQACQQSVMPGINVFDQLNPGDGISCANPPTRTISTTSVTFTGTAESPESLTIDNAGPSPVTITGTLPPFTSLPSLTCSTTNFGLYNWGLIFATGDLSLSNLVFTGFIYTTGTVYVQGTVVLQGGIFATSVQSGTGPSNEVTDAGTLKFCSQGNPIPLLSPRVYTFSTASWEDLPLDER